MPDQPKPTPLELGLYAREEPARHITGIEIGAGVLTCLWLVAVILLNSGDVEGNPGGFADGVLTILAILMPIALIWVAATAMRTARGLREEAARLQASIDQQRRATMDLRPAVVEKLEELVETTRAAQAAGAPVFSSLRALTPPEERAAVIQVQTPPEQPQPGLALSAPVEKDPISVADFIKALNFPENEHDKEGFRTLRRALEDRATERLIRASQDILTLLSQDGIYMDDLRPDRARPEIWRRFAQGERGRAVAALGGIHDRSSLVLAAGRMKKDPVFRDAAHHFLRHFDRTFMDFEKNASDAEIVALAGTRTARAFMLIGRVAGTFD